MYTKETNTMETTSAVARFIAERIQATGKLQTEIAREAGFERPNILTMIKKGQTKVPLARIGALARALDCDPLLLTKMCLSEYCPETWEAIAPVMDEAFTADEVRLIKTMRSAVGCAYVAALTPHAINCLNAFVRAARVSPVAH